MSQLQTALGVALLGAAGSLARWGIGLALDRGLPWGTLVANTVGAFALGLATGAGGPLLPPAWRAPVTAGLLGGFTTFSSLQVQVLQLGGRSGPLAGAGWLALSIGLGLGGAALGGWAARGLR